MIPDLNRACGLDRVIFFTRLIVLTLILLFLGMANSFAQIAPVPLVYGEDAPKLNQYVRYSTTFDQDLTYENITEKIDTFETITTRSIKFDFADEKNLVILQVQNVSEIRGEWVFTMGRKSFYDLKLYEFSPNGTELLIDNKDIQKVRQDTRQYMTLAIPLLLKPGETKTFGILFESKNTFYLPLAIQTPDNYFHKRRVSDVVVFGSIVGILVLVFVNMNFYIFTGMRGFIWLAMAEASYTLQILSSSGYTSYFFWFSDPVQGDFVSAIGKCLFCIFMAKFAQEFVKTKIKFPKIDKLLTGIIIAAIVTLIFSVIHKFIDGGFDHISLQVSWMITLLISSILPFVAVIATVRIERSFWPLIVAWSIFAFFVFYGLVSTLDLIKNLPLVPELAGPVGLIEILFASLSLSLNLGKLQKRNLNNQRLLTESLQEKLKTSDQLRKFAQESANALSVINDQSSLIHASGHDSKQVLLALNSAVQLLNADPDPVSRNEIKQLLESSAEYLDEIVSSTLSGAQMGSSNGDFIALSLVSVDDLLRLLEMLYKKSFWKKNLKLDVRTEKNVLLITDKALLTRALSNYISNSLKFTEVGGVEINAYCEGDSIVIDIIDSGIGLSPDVLEYLDNGDIVPQKENLLISGSGTGYAYSKKAIGSLKGSVSIRNGAKNGTIVQLKLPKASEKVPCTLVELQEILEWCQLVDIDVPASRKVNVKQSLLNVAITYDDTTLTRQKLSREYDMVLYKPLLKSHALHPILNQESYKI